MAEDAYEPSGLLALGNQYKLNGDHLKAEQAYKAILAQDANDPFANSNMGVLCQERGRFIEAVAYYRKALEIRPSLLTAQHNLGFAYVEMGDHEKASEQLQAYLSIKPSDTRVLAQLCHEFMCLGRWKDASNLKPELFRALQSGGSMRCPPFPLLSLFDDPEIIRAVGVSWGNGKRLQGATPFRSLRQRDSREPIRVGYFSSDLCAHALAQLFVGLLSVHDRSFFEVILIRVNGNKQDELTHRLISHADHFLDISKLTDREALATCRSLQLDVAVDLNGFTQSNRVALFLARLAPIQINYLGYPGSMGCQEYDYIVADPVVVSADNRQGFSERVIYLPQTYQPNDRQRPLPPQKTNRSFHQLPASAVVLCCFNNSYKITDEEFSCWLLLLQEFDDAVLWLLASNSAFEANLKSRLNDAGLAPSRLIFTPRLLREGHLERHYHADIFLDTFNYNAHTTASDALWMGLPIVTRMGKSFASRVCASLLRAAGLESLIARTSEEYLEIARSIIKDVHYRQSIKYHLAQNRMRLPLFDSLKYAENFSEGLQRCVNRQHDH